MAIQDLDAEATLKADADELRHIIALRPATGTVVAPHDPTKALMLAVLESGIRDYLSAASLARTEAELWMKSVKRWPFAFPVVCEILGLEPTTLRTALRALRARSADPKVIGRNRPNAGHSTPLRAKSRR